MIDGEERGRTPRPSVAPSVARVGLLAFLGLAPTDCGGGVALLHPAQTLDQGQVRAAAGFAANIAVAQFANAVGDARAQHDAASNTSAPLAIDETYARGALVAASIAPGLAPFVAARVGLGRSFEGGLAYTGRVVRADARRSFGLSRHWALSVGAGGSAALSGRRREEPALPGVDLSALHGWGADVPVLLGYASDADLYLLWLGGRAGWEHVDASDVRSRPDSLYVGPASLSATRFWGGALVGLAVGFRHVHLSMELDISYASVTGEYAGVHARAVGLTLAPATAVWWKF